MKKFFFLTITLFASVIITAQTSSGKHHIKYLEVNTAKSDYGVTFLDNDKVVFSMPADDGPKNKQQDLYTGDISEEGEIINKEPVKGLIHSKKISKTGITYSNDLKTVYFSAKKYKRRKNKERSQIFKATVDSTGNWINIETLPFNSKKYSSEQPSLSKDGKKLYFVSNRASSYGGTDIFVVDIKEDGTYGEPVNLGDKINTKGNEVTPYITENNILYFSSNGREDTFGNLDVYASEIFENTVSEPLHLESPVNSINDDFAYIVNNNSDGGYFSSNRLQGQGNDDIYSFTIEEDKPEKCLQQIAGVVRDKETNAILKDAAITLFDNDGNQVQQVLTDKDGIYNLTLDCNQTYTLVASTLYHRKEEHVINTANYNRAPTLEANKFLVKKSESELAAEAIASTTKTEDTVKEETIKESEKTTEKTEPIETGKEEGEKLNSIYFGFDKSNITKESAKELDRIVTIMNENDALKIEIASFTDARGSSAYNVKLSNRRAQSTIDYLVSKGIDRNRIKGKGYGETKMVNKCIDGVQCSETSHSLNRRTEFNFYR